MHIDIYEINPDEYDSGKHKFINLFYFLDLYEYENEDI